MAYQQHQLGGSWTWNNGTSVTYPVQRSQGTTSSSATEVPAGDRGHIVRVVVAVGSSETLDLFEADGSTVLAPQLTGLNAGDVIELGLRYHNGFSFQASAGTTLIVVFQNDA